MINPIPVRLEIADPKLKTDFERVILSVVGFLVTPVEKAQPGEIFIRELGEDYPREIEGLKSLIETDQTREVFACSGVSDQKVLLTAMRAGVREFFPLPLVEDDLRLALWSAKERREKAAGEAMQAGGMLVDVIGAKGGVGATTLAVNLAAACLELPGVRSVALVDMSLPYSDAHLFIDAPPTRHWAEAAKNLSRLDATFLLSFFTRHPSGLQVLLSPGQAEDMAMASPESVARILALTKTMFDVVVVDNGSYLDEVSMTIMDAAETILLVGAQSLPCVNSMRRLLRHFQMGGPVDKLKLVLSRSLKDADLTVQDAEKSLNAKFFHTLPEDYPTALSAVNLGKFLKDVAPKAQLTRSINEMARQLVGPRFAEAADPAEKKTSRIFGLFGRK